MEGSSSTTAPTEGFPKLFDENYVEPTRFTSNLQIPKGDDLGKAVADIEGDSSASGGEFTDSVDDKFYGDDEGMFEEFVEETLSDGESTLAAEFAAMVALPEEFQVGEPRACKPEDLLVETETENKFEQFDVVQDCSGHYFANHKPSTEGKNKITKLLSMLHINLEKKHQEPTDPPKDWVRRIQQEWKSLEKDLPEGIFVRVYEDRMDLLRAVIVGSAGTPYHDGLFFFDIGFPLNYPDVPPRVWHHSHGLRLNPNLYANGVVCLSLLGTWQGRGCEKWNSRKSTLLQVLLSLQAIVLNSTPYFNEPGYSRHRHTTSGQRQSLAYNQSVFLLSCKTMLYTLRQPPQHFEGFVTAHFRLRGRAILLACMAYMEGATVESELLPAGRDGKGFGSSPRDYYNSLLREFRAKGVDCEGLLPA